MKNLVSKIIRFERKNPQYKKTIAIMYCLLYVLQRVTDFMDSFIRQTQRIILKKQIVSLVLTLILVISMITQPISVYANEETNGDIPIDEEHFPDAGFRKYLQTVYHSAASDGKFTPDEIEKITELNMNNFGSIEITDLKGIEYFTSLTSFAGINLGIESLDVSKNTKLTYLNCGDNPNLVNLNLKGVTALEQLYCYNTKISTLDVNENKELNYLSCYNTEIKSLDVSNHTKLTTLLCHSNENLNSLNVQGTIALKDLQCYGTGIESLNVSGCTALKELNCRDNENLKTLNVNNATALETLYCLETVIESLNISNNTELTKLSCYNTKITSLDVSKNTKLNYLDCEGVPLAYLNIGTNTTLSTFYISLSSITLEMTEDTFNIGKMFAGIDSKKVTMISGAQYDSETGEVSEYKAGTSIRYSYNCGTVNGEEKTLNVRLTLKGLKKESKIQITSNLDKAYNGKSDSNPNIWKTGSTGSVTYTWEMKKGNDWEKIESAPNDAGEYRVTAILEADDNYKSAKSEPVEFEISQATNSWEKDLSIDNWTYREEAKEPTSEAKFGEVKYIYSKKGLNQYSTTVPTTAGNWTVKATVEGTDNYKGIEATKDFTIYKAEAPAITEPQNLSGIQDNKLSTVALPEDWSWVDKDTVLKTTNSGYEARMTVDDENYNYTSVIGYNQGNHYVERILKVVVPKFENSWTVEPSIENWTYNEIASTPIGAAKHGTVIFTYSSSENGGFTKNKPTTAGTWYMKAYVPADDEYKELTFDTIEFKILKASNSLKIISTTEELTTDYTGKTYDKTPEVNKPNDYRGTVTFKWEKKKADGTWEELLSKPTDTGTYQVSAIASEDNNYQKTTSYPVEFEISQATNSWKKTLSIDNWTYEKEANKPTSEAKFGEVKYTYSDKQDGIFTDKVPTDAGIWYVKATVIGTDNYKGIEATRDFIIYKAKAPAIIEPQNLSGVQDNKLSTVALTKDWSWVDKNTVLKANNKGYEARLTVDDENYDYTGIAGYNQDNHYVERTLKVVVPKFENEWTVDPSIENWTYNETASTPVGTAKHGTVIFTYSSSKDVEFTKNKPTTAGTWYMKAYVSADDEYKELIKVIEFKILKAENIGLKIISTSEELTTDYTGKIYDKTPKVSTPDDYRGTVTFKWKKVNGDRWEELESAPINAGKYGVSVIASEDSNYNEIFTSSLIFEIRKAESTITVKGTLDKAYDSNSVSNPTIDKTGSSKTPVYTWEKKNGNDWEKLESAPKDVGEYRVKIDVAEDDNYKSATATKEFKISQATNSWKDELHIENWTYKEEAKEPTSQAKFGEVKYTYSDKQDGVFTSKVPTDAGTWYVKATVEETDNYKGIEATKDFVIQKAEPIYTLPVNLNAVYGQTLGEIALDDGFEWVEPLKKVGDAGDVTAMIRYTPDDSNYKTVTVPVVIKVNRAENEWKVSPSIENWTYGEKANVPTSQVSFGEVKYTYSSSKNGKFTENKPTTAGTWYVKAQVNETSNYTGLEEVREFKINKAIPTVEMPTNLKGVEEQLLSTVTLSKGWTWTDGNIMLSVQNSGYKARLIVDDTNYDYTSVEGYNKENHYVERTLNVSVASKEAGSIQKEVKKGNNAPDIKIPMTESQLANIVLTDEEKKAVEKGSDIKIVLTVDDASGQIGIKDKTVVESVLGEMKIGQYLDVSLLKIIDHEESRISQTKGVIRITIEIPESLRKANREFVMIRVHDGVATILKDLDTDTNTIMIETDRFSTYAIAYQDKQSNIAETEDRTVIGGYIILVGLSGMLLFINRKQKRI